METMNIFELQTPSGATLSVQRYRFGTGEGPTVAFVAGVRGDAPEGIRVAFRLMQALRTLEPDLKGYVDVYPCINPLAAEQGRRLWPGFDIDQNRQFPGKADGHPPARLAHRLTEDLKHADLVVEIRGARLGFVEIPQAMIRETQVDNEILEGVTLLDIARQCNTPIVWTRRSSSIADKTLGKQFENVIVLEGGQGNRLTEDVGDIFSDGCLYLLTRTTVLPETLLPFPWMAMEDPVLVRDDAVIRTRVNTAGLFLPSTRLNATVESGDLLGMVLDPRTSAVVEKITSSRTGRIIALRNQPVVSPGDMVVRLQALEAV